MIRKAKVNQNQQNEPCQCHVVLNLPPLLRMTEPALPSANMYVSGMSIANAGWTSESPRAESKG